MAVGASSTSDRALRSPPSSAVVSPTVAELGAGLERLATAQEALRRALSRRLGISASEFTALSLLLGARHRTPKELAERLGVASSSVTYAVDRLEEAGLLVRRMHPLDRRSLLLELTEDGRTAVEEAYARYHGALDAALADSEERRAAQVLRFIADATDRLNATASEVTS